MCGGVGEGSSDHCGSILMTSARVSVTVSPQNAVLPVSISYNTQPKAQISGSPVDGLASRLLGGHICRCSHNDPSLRCHGCERGGVAGVRHREIAFESFGQANAGGSA